MKKLFTVLALLIIAIPISGAFLYGLYHLGVVHILETMNVNVPNFTYDHCLTASILIVSFRRSSGEYTEITEAISYLIGKICVNLLILLVLYLIWIF
jgi:hypothetical protein